MRRRSERSAARDRQVRYAGGPSEAVGKAPEHSGSLGPNWCHPSQVAEIIGALPPDSWTARLTGLTERAGISPTTLGLAVLDAGHAWTDNPHGLAKQQIAEPLPDQPIHTEPTRPAAEQPVTAAQRWADLADHIHPQLSSDPGWPSLADTLDHAAAHGYDVTGQLPTLAASNPLPNQHTARSLEYRLLIACPDALSPADRQLSQASHDKANAIALTRTACTEHSAGIQRAAEDPELIPTHVDPGQRGPGARR